MCGCDTGMLHMPKPTNIAELKTAKAAKVWNVLPQEFNENGNPQSGHLERDFERVLLQLADTEHSL